VRASDLVLPCIVLVASWCLTWCVKRYALAKGILDVPNVRSSHTTVVPRGGGLAIVSTSMVAMLFMGSAGTMDLRLLAALSGGGVAVATIGFLDDRFHIPASVRLLVHSGASLWAIYILGGVPALQVGSNIIELGALGYIAAFLAIIWATNLFNFMDGIDGIAGTEAVFMAFAGAIFCLQAVPDSTVAGPALLVCAATLGFLLWNWPPAQIFMGDVGSGYLGFVVAILAFAAARENPVAFFIWLVLGGVFFVDATVTLVRRLLRGERLHQAHRTHAYQWLARRWGSHRRVTVGVLFVNLCWLLPLAWLAAQFPDSAFLIAGVALAPLVIGAWVARAGRPES
jgi:Fuc2NAc and GlcNAc transferase